MRKQSRRKLQLEATTLRQLAVADLRAVAGGDSENCGGSCRIGCASCPTTLGPAELLR